MESLANKLASVCGEAVNVLLADEKKDMEITELRLAIQGLRHGDDCWCQVAIGNPMLQGKHTAACIEAARVTTT